MAVFAASAQWRRIHERIHEAHTLETHGPLGTLIAGLGLGAFYAALIWVNLLLGHMLTPLFLIPLTWLQDKVLGRRRSTRTT